MFKYLIEFPQRLLENHGRFGEVFSSDRLLQPPFPQVHPLFSFWGCSVRFFTFTIQSPFSEVQPFFQKLKVFEKFKTSRFTHRLFSGFHEVAGGGITRWNIWIFWTIRKHWPRSNWFNKKYDKETALIKIFPISWFISECIFYILLIIFPVPQCARCFPNYFNLATFCYMLFIWYPLYKFVKILTCYG